MGERGEYDGVVPPLDDCDGSMSRGLCRKLSLVGVEIWVTWSGLGAGFRWADRGSPDLERLRLFNLGALGTAR